MIRVSRRRELLIADWKRKRARLLPGSAEPQLGIFAGDQRQPSVINAGEEKKRKKEAELGLGGGERSGAQRAEENSSRHDAWIDDL